MAKREMLPVFVYGTLRPGEKNYDRYLAGRTARELPASVRGRLFFLAEEGYPYLSPGEGMVVGELVFIDPAHYAETLRALDELEEYDPENEAESVYLRRRAKVLLAAGGAADAWVYYWNQPQMRGEPVEGGDFRRR